VGRNAIAAGTELQAVLHGYSLTENLLNVKSKQAHRGEYAGGGGRNNDDGRAG